jgi:flavin-dependent dehydrogenase
MTSPSRPTSHRPSPAPVSGTYDAIVIGARVAGATTALLLARAGLRVLLVDRSRPGTGVLSTHALMRGGVLQLSRLGLLDDVVAAGTPPIRRTVIRYGDVEEVVDIRPSAGVDALYAPDRVVFDRLLVAAAERAGVDVRFRTTLTGLRRGRDGEVVGVELRDATGRPSTACAPITVGADGVRSAVAREVGALTYERAAASGAMAAAYVTGVEADGYQWLYAERAAAGVIPTNGGRMMVWTSVPQARFLHELRGRPDHGLAEVLGEVAPEWAAAVAAGTPDGPVRGFAGVPGYLRQPWGRGWALVGDAGAFKDPITTHGMTDALRDAELLARAVVAALGGQEPWSHAAAAYQDTRDAVTAELRAATERVAGYRWSLPDLRGLLLDVARAMRPTVDHLRSLDAPPTLPTPPTGPTTVTTPEVHR